MKKLLFLLSLVFLFSTCKEVLFETPQPTKSRVRKTFPKKLVGTYLDKNKDTLIIAEHYYKYTEEVDDAPDLTEGNMDNTVVKKMGKYYFVNKKMENGWYVIIMKKHKDGQLFMSGIDSDKDKVIKQIRQITEVKEVLDMDGNVSDYLIAPTKRELKTLLKAGVFKEEMVFQKID